MRPAARVRVEPAGFDLLVDAGETVFAAALRSGATWPTVCYGQTRCTACALRVVDGRQNLVPAGQAEREALRQVIRRGGLWSARDARLACRLMVTGDVTVEKKGAKPAERPSKEPR